MDIKKRIKHIVNSYPRLTANQIIKKISDFDVVSFDIFDTLLKRDVAVETDVFEYIGRMYFNRFGVNIPEFREKRIEAWREAVKSSEKEEISLQDIYTKLVDLNSQKIDPDTARKLMEIELELEKELCSPNPVMAEVFQYCAKAGKRIICISDMYLEKAFILELLHKSGYTKINAVYLSSEIGFQKRSGALFRYVLETENLRPGELIHIGDNKRSDFLVAAKLGIHTVCIARKDWHTLYWKPRPGDLDSNAVRAFMSNRLYGMKDRREAIGYEVYGPLLYFFTKWLCERLDNSKPILFFARDCYIVKQAYELMSPSASSDKYFLASRKSLMMPALHRETSLQQVFKMIRTDGFLITLEDILKKFALETKKYEAVVEKQGLSLQTMFQRDNLAADRRFLDLWPFLVDEIKENSREQYNNFRKYFNSIDPKDEIQVVDIGWRCTMQYCLQMILQGEYTIHGYYIGVKGDTFLRKSEYDGFFIDGTDSIENDILISEIPALLEVFFSAPHGSVQGYDLNGKVIFGEYEYENSAENKLLAKKLQDGALKFVRDWLTSPFHELIHPAPELLFMGIEPLATQPMREEIDMFADLPFNSGVVMTKFAAPKSLLFYLLNPKQCLYDLANSYWKIAFLKRLFRIPFPYDKLFQFMYKLKRRLCKDNSQV